MRTGIIRRSLLLCFVSLFTFSIFPVAAITQPDKAGDDAKFIWGKVTEIYDGDTIAMTDDKGEFVRVQLAYIDAPDLDIKTGDRQPLYNESLNTLKEMILNKEVIVESLGVDRFGRVEGIVFLDRTNVNLEMTRKGMAEIYYPVRINPGQYSEYYVTRFQAAEKMAKEDRTGVWGQSDYISPYQFRRRSRE